MFHQAIQKIRRLLGLTVATRETHGSGSTQVIPPKAAPTLQHVGQRDRFKAYDPIPYNRNDIPYGVGRVSTHYNKMCSQVGVQSSVRMDPYDWKTIYDFKNVDKTKLVRIRWYENKQSHEVLLEPGESTTIKIGKNLSDAQQYPEVKAFTYGEE